MISAFALRRSLPNLGQAKPRPFPVIFRGGNDRETPPLAMQPGYLRSSLNYEADINGGYGRVVGYERYSGKTSPSAASASVIDITLTGAISVGDTVTDATSSATAVVIAVPDSTHIVVTKIAVSTFATGHVLNVSGNPQATTTSGAHGASTAKLRAQYKNLAADEYRDDIAAPTGSGSSLGGVRYGNVLYVWRNNAGGTATDIWKSTASGWSQITLYNEISFTVGAVAIPAEGATLTQGGVTATLKRLVLTSGTFAAGSAAGRMIITNPAGGNFAAGAATLTGGVTCTLSAIQTAITLLPSGRYQFVVDNFGGSVATTRIYGSDGVNRGFEFDGTVLVPISTGMTTDAPTNVHVHQKQLFFSFGASVQHSAPTTPYVWSAILGASEIGMGDTVTGFATQPGSQTSGALAIFTRNRLSVLNGTGVSNWVLIPYRKELGAYQYSIQDVGYTIFLDDQGVTDIRTSQVFGNFQHASLSQKMRRWVNGKRTKTVASCVSRDKSQYRLFFSDSYVLYSTLGSGVDSSGNTVSSLSLMPVRLANAATWAWSSEESDGSEVIFFGSTNGMVYQMEKGTSFDGSEISHFLYTSWNWLKSPRLIKRFHNASLEVSGNGYAEFSFSYKLGYGSTDISQPSSQTEVTSFTSGTWDDLGPPVVTWDQVGLVWDGQTLFPSLVDMGGEAENVSLVITGASDYQEAIRFSGAMIHYSMRRYLQ